MQTCKTCQLKNVSTSLLNAFFLLPKLDNNKKQEVQGPRRSSEQK